MKRAASSLMALLLLATAHAALAQAVAPQNLEETDKEPQDEGRHRSAVDPAEWAPDNALFYLGVTDVDRTWKNFQKTSGYQMMQDPAAAEAIPGFDVFGEVAEKLRERLSAALDVPPSQLKNPFSGPLAFFISAAPGATFDDVEPGLVASVGDAEQMRQYYDTAVDKLKELAQHETVKAGQDRIDVFTPEPKEEDEGAADQSGEEGGESFDEFGAMGGPPIENPMEMLNEGLDELFSADSLPQTLALCLTEDRLIVGASLDQVKAILRGKRRDRTLADTDDHKALLRHLKRTGTVRFLLNLPQVVELAKSSATGDTEAQELRDWLRVLGAENLRSLVGHWRLGGSSYDSKMEMLFLMGSERVGLARILSMENAATTPPDTISADACIYANVNLNVAWLLDEIERMVRQSDPAAADQMRASLENMPSPTGGAPINVRRDFLDHLRGPLTVTLGFTKPLGASSLRMLIAMGHRDQAAVARFLGNLVGMLIPRDLRGTQVFETPYPQGLAVASTPQQLVIGNATAVEGALEPAAAQPLAETDAWRRAARFVPDESWLTFYMDNREFTAAVLALAEKQDELMLGGMTFDGMFLAGMLEGFQAEMGDGDGHHKQKLLDYTAPAILTVSSAKEGVRITYVQLKPDR